MEGSNLRQLVDKEAVMEMRKSAAIGLASGTVWGALVYDRPQAGSNVKYAELMRASKVCGDFAATGAVLGAMYVGIEQALEKYRGKKDFVNGAVAGFAAGASVLGIRGGSFRTGLRAGSVLALTSALLHVALMEAGDEH